MGTGASELTLAQLAAIGTYSNVIFFNDPSDTDLLKTIVGSPRTILINLGQLLNVGDGEVQGDAVAPDEITAAEIAAGAVDTAELADGAVTGLKLDATPSLFETATTFLQEHDTGAGDILAADASNDRLVIVQAEVTEAFVTTSWEIDVGSTGNSDGLFDDIFAGVSALAVGETVVGVYMLPATEALAVTETSMVGDTAGIIQFSIIPITITHANASIADAVLASSIVKEPGRVAQGLLDFAGVATAAVTVTIGAVTYLEADVEDFPNGVWTNGASANDSAVSLAAAINGDTRTTPLLYAAVVLTDTVFVFAKVVGTAGNVSMSVSADEPAVIDNMIGGAAAAVKQTVTIQHVVTAAEVAVAGTAPEVLIPLPFDAAYFSWQVYDSTGGIYATEVTARGTVTDAAGNVPAYFRLANNGATDIQAGDIIRLVAQE